MSFRIAREKGYKKVFSRAAVNNIANVNLHKKCGFTIIEKTISTKGNEVYDYVYLL